MNFYNFHVNDFRGATWHLDRLHRSIYRDLIDEYYLTEKPLMGDLVMLAHKMGCRSESEQAALAQVLNEFFVKKNGKWHHKRIDRELKNYHYRNGGVTESNANSNESVTDEVTERNAKSNAERQAKLREQAKQYKDYLTALGVDFDKKMKFSELKNLFISHGGVTESNANSNESVTDEVTERNAKKSSITKNQEPIVNTPTPHAQARSVADDVVRFALPLDWQPSQNAVAGLRMAGLGMDLSAYPEGLVNFRLYWSSQLAEFTQAQWESKFVAALVSDKQHERNDFLVAKTPTAPTTDVVVQSTPANAPSKTKQSVMTLMSVREAVVSDSLKTVLPKSISLVLVDGLLDLLGNNLKYPPAADSWEFTLTAWANEFARSHLGDDDVGRVQAAFNAAKAKATHPDNHERRFPDVADVLSCLPMKLVQKQLEHKLSQEEWAEQSAKGRERTAGLKAILSRKSA